MLKNESHIFYSESKRAFFDDRVHISMPEDAVNISEEEYSKKFAELSIGTAVGDTVNPSLQLIKKNLDIANYQIAILKPAVDGGYAKPEHTQLLADWQRYRYELTLVTEQSGWPDKPQWPDQPATVI